MSRTLAILLITSSTLFAEVIIKEDFSSDPIDRSWKAFGASELFQWNSAAERLQTTWDSSKTNSFYYLPLPYAVDSNDDFEVSLDFMLDDLAIGTSPGKAYTFELAVGFFRWEDARNPALYRGSGVNGEHGPRNLVEFDYFADSGFGATIAPTIASSNNQISFSDNHPFELTMNDVFHLQMKYEALSRNLRTTMKRNNEPFPEDVSLRDLTLNAGVQFQLNAFGISSYSDAGQNPPQFSGSLMGHGWVDNIEIRLPDSPISKIELEKAQDRNSILFISHLRWNYLLERTTDWRQWEGVGNEVEGNGSRLALVDPASGLKTAFYRIRATKQPNP
jgi:hypothetical protein